jgi:8-oxo-dGTP pyrophosphatase MutT (NUDIX family)
MGDREQIPQVVMAARAVIVDEHQHILLVQRRSSDTNPDEWEFPGGKPETDVDLRDADLNETLLREVEEETGFLVAPVHPLDYTESRMIENGKYKGLPYFAVFSLAKVVSGILRLSEEHQAAAWEHYDAAREYNLTTESRNALEAFALILGSDSKPVL